MTKLALLLAVLGVEAVGGREVGVSMSGGHQISKVLVKILDISIWSVTHVWIDLNSCRIGNVAAIW